MPMRGTLPLRNLSLQIFRETTTLERAVLLLLNSPDFAVICFFAVVGIFISLSLALMWPSFNEVLALFALTT
jgi:hypothetical protein